MWWEILKSSRAEAYAKFIEEFGPEVELDSLRVSPHEDVKQVQIDSSDSEWVVNYAILSSGEEQFTFESMRKYGRYENFVEGMFEMEYPERYQELLEMAREALPETNIGGDSGVPVGLYQEAAKTWLSEHEFYAVNDETFDMSRRGVRRNLLKCVIAYYEDVSFEDADRYLDGVSLADISDYPDLLTTLISWVFIVAGKPSVARTFDMLKTAQSQMHVIRAINSGDLDDISYMKDITGPVRIRKIKED